jgi:probable F420-dependent oxidoreductase
VRFTIEHPIGGTDCAPDLYGPTGLPVFARAAEEAGFDALAFTEHPAPSAKWLSSGGHATLDPVAALGFVAAATTRLRIMPFLLILPYRNPLLGAKSIVSLDLLSGGRLVVGAGGGYLRSEFGALGVDFEERGALFDEALDVLRGVCTDPEYRYAGRHFTARGVTMVPGPVQRPHPPVWIGGNGRTARRRVVRAGQGWSPLIADEQRARTTRMPAITSVSQMGSAISELHDLLVEAGRDPKDVDVQVQSSAFSGPLGPELSVEQVRDHLGELEAVGVSQFVVRCRASSVAEATDELARYGAEIILHG